MARSYLTVVVAVLLAAAVTPDYQKAKEANPLAKILADWQTRREYPITVLYRIEGTRLWPKGARNPDPLLLRQGARPGQDNPDHDVKASFTRIALLDFSNNRFRIGWDNPEYDGFTRKVYRIRCTEVCDGKTVHCHILENGEPCLGQGQAKPHVDFLIQRGLLPNPFNVEYLPLFLGHGVVSYGNVSVEPDKLRPKPNAADFRYRGQGIDRERPCAILRTVSERGQTDFWVDLERKSAVVKQVYNPDSHVVSSTVNVRYQNFGKTWLVEGWTRSQFEDNRLWFAEEVRVTHAVVDPAVSEDDFRIETKPGMYVEDQNYFIDKRGQYKSDSRYYRIEPGGLRTELDKNLYPIASSKTRSRSPLH